MHVTRSDATQEMFLVPLMETVILITLSNKTKKISTTKINSSLQQRPPPFNETDINTLRFSQQLSHEITIDATSLNTTTEICPTVQPVFKLPSLLTV